MEDAPSPLETRKLINAFELDINYNEKPIKIKFNNSDEDMEIIINVESDSSSKKNYTNIFSLQQLYNISNYFKMFDKIIDLIPNLKTLIEENKYNLTINDKSLIINFSPGIVIKGKIELELFIKEKNQQEKIDDLIELTQSLLKRMDKLEKENNDLKEEVKELREKLNKNINQDESKKDIFNDSVILKNENDKNTMIKLLNKQIKNATLLYRGTMDGDNAKNFHEKCDNKGPTLTLCLEKNGIIFGGYTEAEWDSESRHPKYDKNAFIFSVTYNKKFVTKNYDNSIHCNPEFGPVFGFGGDLTIWNKFLSSKLNNMWTKQETYYDINFEIVNGKRSFFLNELEVYLIN